VEKYSRLGQATDCNMAHADCMLDTSAYKHILRICNIIAFPVQQLLQECASGLGYAYIASLVVLSSHQTLCPRTGFSFEDFTVLHVFEFPSAYYMP
jgi:hypothetical protein